MKIKLSQAFDLQMGKTPARNNTAYWNGSKKWVSIADIGNSGKYIADTKECITDKGVRESGIKAVPKETVIMSFKLSIGKTAITAEELYTNEAIMAFIDKGIYAIDPAYFYHLCCGKNWTAGTNKAVMGLTLNKATISGIEINIPDIAEQRKIAARLDCLDTVIADRQLQLEYLDQLVKSRFIELFGDPVSNPMKWDICQLEECLDRIDNGKSFICSDKPRTGDNPAILKLSAATYGDYRPNENKALLDESLFVEISEVHAGDLLFTRKNTPALVGMAAYVQNTPPKLMLPDLIFRLVPNERVNAVFLWKLINCKEFRPVIQAISGGSAKSMSNISKERLGKIKVICPPRELQDSLIPFVEQTDKSKLAVQKSLEELEILKKSLMQQYFG